MQRINIHLSAPTILLRYSAFTLSRLRANPLLSELADQLEQAEAELKGVVLHHEDRIKSGMAALAVRDSRKYELDVALRVVRLAVLSTVRNNRGARLYRTVEEIEQARNVLTKLDDIELPALGPAAEGLRAAIDTLSQAIAESQAADRAEAGSRAVLLTAKTRFAATYEDLYRQLTNIFGDWRMAETCFRRFPKVKKQPEPAAVSELQPEPARPVMTLSVVSPSIAWQDSPSPIAQDQAVQALEAEDAGSLRVGGLRRSFAEMAALEVGAPIFQASGSAART